uniref:MAP7 domain containing 3 n=1 Tax=Neogobius melanostomus TaxID=47308 RepID=A0A8C6SNK8_9GOBI
MAAAAQAQAEERRSLTGNSPVPAANTVKAQGCKPVIDGAALRVDDKLRVARERREEADKQHAVRESQIMERERKTKLQVERQMEERQKKVEEQRKKEEQKRLAAEEKRKQKQEEEKEHYKAVMLRTLERSQKVDQRQKRWSWGGLTDSDGRAGIGFYCRISLDKRSTSTTNLRQPSEAGISKRLSSSSTALGKSPDKSKSLHVLLPLPFPLSTFVCKPFIVSNTRRPPANTVDEGLVSRLLTPTQASLARSKSAAALSAEGTDSPECHLCPRSASASSLQPWRGPVRSRSISADGAIDPSLKNRQTLPGAQRPASPSSTRNRSPSPAPNHNCSTFLSRQSSKARPPSPGALKQRPPSPQPSKPPPIQKPALTPTGPPTLRKRNSKSNDLCSVQPVAATSPDASKTKEKDGTNSAAEAAKILAENRRLMREQKEKEEQLRIQKEEEEKVRLEEEKRLAEEARLKRVEEEKKLAEERKVREEEEAREAEEERVRQAAEEALRQAELQREKEEADARALEEAKRFQEERERQMQQNQQERMERKKRIDEIMKRTRKGDQSDSKVCSPLHNICVKFEGDNMALLEDEMAVHFVHPQSALLHYSTLLFLFIDITSLFTSVSVVPKTRVVEGSEFVNEQDAARVTSGLNGKSNLWSLEGLIDLNGHNSRPLIQAEDCNQGNRVTYEDKTTPVNTIHSSNQPMEALSGERQPLNTS